MAIIKNIRVGYILICYISLFKNFGFSCFFYYDYFKIKWLKVYNNFLLFIFYSHIFDLLKISCIGKSMYKLLSKCTTLIVKWGFDNAYVK